MYSLYKGDKLHGEYYEYYEDETPKIQTCYTDGKLHGEYKSWNLQREPEKTISYNFGQVCN